MNVFTSLLIAIIQLFSLKMAEWYPESPLILIHDRSKNLKMFPQVVYQSETYTSNYILYYEPEAESRSVTYAYCPRIHVEDKLCNYPVQYVSKIWGELKWLMRCHVRVSPDVILVKENEEEKMCLHNDRIGFTYKFVYWLCQGEGEDVVREELSIYEMCYESSKDQIILGGYTIPNPKLLAQRLLAEEQSYSFFPQEPQHYLYEEHPEYVPRSVLPTELLPFAHQRRPLFNAKNIAPMHKYVITRWEEVMANLKARISKMTYEVHVTAGLIDVMRNANGSTKYLGDGMGLTEIQIPQLFWLMINNNNATLGVVIIIYNKRYIKKEDGNVKFFDQKLCSYAVCHTANLWNIDASDMGRGYYIYCCYTSAIFKAFDLHSPHNRSVILKFHDA